MMLAAVVPSAPVAAQDASHGALTTLDLKACRMIVRGGVNGKTWRCPGLSGYPVTVSEVDDRMFLSVGPAAEKQRAAQQTLRAPNTLFPAGSTRATIEWRVPLAAAGLAAPKRVQPYATIVRYTTARDAARGQVIVVSKVTPTENCHVALIDAAANADALALARSIADTIARAFDCAKPPTVQGATGKSPM